MFFLDQAWLVPFIPALSFVAILLFGKRFPRHGSEVGIAAVGASFVLSVGAVIQWVNRVNDAEGGQHNAFAGVVHALGRSVGHLSVEERLPAVQPVVHHVTWLQNGGFELGTGTQIDGLAVMMMFVVTTISLLVHVYSVEYMKGDRRYTYFFAALSLFTASMLLLVVADNTLQLLIGWELVGVCSFMLIGHWWEEKPNSNAAIKAFLTTRTGDVGLMIGVIMTFFLVQRATGHGSFNIVAVNNGALSGKVGHTFLLVCASMLFLGIIGKSGQFPLHTWLPDAMAGPTPVSALIHAATMVVAGVYLGARVFPVFWEGFSIHAGGINFMAAIGGITILVGASLAFVQDDIKKVLAYSTISQLGYMVMGLGVGAWTAAVFHLFTHAFFKANLFLGAGSVSHSGSHHSFDMKKDMGGLRKYMPETFWTFIIGTIALAGIFPLAGFWSKDEILVTANEADFKLFFYVGLIGALMTAAYMTRCIYLTFFGEYRGGETLHDEVVAHVEEHGETEIGHAEDAEGDVDLHLDAHGSIATATHAADAHDAHGEHHAAPHESNRTITGPLWILSFFSIVAGFINAPGIEKFHEWFQPRVAFPEVVHADFSVPKAIISVAVALLGAALAYGYYWRGMGLQNFAERNAFARAGKHLLVKKYYLDDLYENVIVAGIKGPIARAVYWFNQHVIDNVLNYTGRGAVALGRATYEYVDQRGVDGAVNGLAVGTGDVGGWARVLQNGRVQFYALTMVFAVATFGLVLWIAS